MANGCELHHDDCYVSGCDGCLAKPLVKCPECDGKAGHASSGDGWEEWDECRCCNPNGKNDSGLVSEKRLAEFRKAEAAEAARWDKIIADAEARGELT